MTYLARFLSTALFLACGHDSPVVIPIASGPANVAQAEAGVDGVVLRVTTLAADGAGSLKKAIQDERPRIIVFEVGGVIDLGGKTLTVRSPHVTIAGQTAPDPGITLIRGSLVVETYDVVVSHIAVRPGDHPPSPREWSPDALGVRRGDNGPVHHVVFDHCSATWSIDENLSTSGPADVDPSRDPDVTAHDITLRSCLIAEALSNSTHPKGEHSKGTLVHDGVRNVSIINCVYAHNRERNPRLKGGSSAVVAGNVMYNWGSACVGVGARGNDKMLAPAEASVIGNVAIAGADTKGKVFVKSVDPGGRVYLRDNTLIGVRDADDGVVRLTSGVSVTYKPALESLRTAGSRPARRDPIDARIIGSIVEGTGHIIDSQDEVSGYPVRAATSRKLDVPDTGRAEWLRKMSEELGEDTSVNVEKVNQRIAKSGMAVSGTATH